MQSNLRILKLNSLDELKNEFQNIGVDPAGFELMASKGLQVNIKVKNLSVPAALILKQEMLSLGGDCANHRMVLKNEVDSADSILMGNAKIFQRLIPKLKNQPFGLKKLADDFLDKDQAVKHAIQMQEDGADIIDIGAESTRPGADPVPKQEELDRLIPIIEFLKKEVDIPVSVDTYKSDVAEEALKNGANIINDISGLRFDPEMKNVLAKYNVPVILMHIKGEPKNMQTNPEYENLMDEIYEYLADSINLAETAGIKKENIVVDPGIGFGKRLMDNYEIIKRLSEFNSLGCPVLIGPSRKSFIGKVLDLPPQQRLEGTAAAITVAIQNGAHIIRVHDVKEMARVCRIGDLLAKR
ncbi:dihydropteroate synthase [candidate division KSB1 bacterium 4572_119]|nr:MAG: dihydropteroate synthase [candidate division KSB1 bacterium 4572_119]